MSFVGKIRDVLWRSLWGSCIKTLWKDAHRLTNSLFPLHHLFRSTVSSSSGSPTPGSPSRPPIFHANPSLTGSQSVQCPFTHYLPLTKSTISTPENEELRHMSHTSASHFFPAPVSGPRTPTLNAASIATPTTISLSQSALTDPHFFQPLNTPIKKGPR